MYLFGFILCYSSLCGRLQGVCRSGWIAGRATKVQRGDLRVLEPEKGIEPLTCSLRARAVSVRTGVDMLLRRPALSTRVPTGAVRHEPVVTQLVTQPRLALVPFPAVLLEVGYCGYIGNTPGQRDRNRYSQSYCARYLASHS